MQVTILLRSISKHQKASASSSYITTKGDSRSLIPTVNIVLFRIRYIKNNLTTEKISSLKDANLDNTQWRDQPTHKPQVYQTF
jgi:hypothetical protein